MYNIFIYLSKQIYSSTSHTVLHWMKSLSLLSWRLLTGRTHKNIFHTLGQWVWVLLKTMQAMMGWKNCVRINLKKNVCYSDSLNLPSVFDCEEAVIQGFIKEFFLYIVMAAVMEQNFITLKIVRDSWLNLIKRSEPDYWHQSGWPVLCENKPLIQPLQLRRHISTDKSFQTF